MAERRENAAPFSLALAAVALQSLALGLVVVEVGADLLDLIVERTALRRLSTEQGEKAGALAPQTLRLLCQPIELGLLLCRGVVVTPDLLGFGRFRCAPVDRRESPFQAQASGIAPWRHTPGAGELAAGGEEG